jgi:hypothetical protein
VRISVLVFLAVGLGGCASTSTREPPIVDMRGVDAQKYASDLHDCTESSQGFITFGAPISRCLTQRGYTVTVPKT